MKMKIQPSYKILGEKIKIKKASNLEYAGLWLPKDNTIILSTNQDEKDFEETFWHEMNHMMQWKSGVVQAVSRELLEVMAEMNSRMVAEIIRQS